MPHFDIAVTLNFIRRNPESTSRDRLPNAMAKHIYRLVENNKVPSVLNASSGVVAQLYELYQTQFNLDNNLREKLNELENAGTSEIEEHLPLFFAFDLYRYMQAKELSKCVLFFDTYELLWDSTRKISNRLSADKWVRDLAGIELLNNTIFVLSGREKLIWSQDNPYWEDKVLLVGIDVLEPQYAAQYLSSCLIDDENIKRAIIEAANGHPYYLDLCVDTYYKLKNSKREVLPSSFGNGSIEIQDRFFKSLEEREINTLRALSVPRFYDAAIFAMLANGCNTGYPVTGFDDFNTFSFIKCNVNDKFYIHILMRDEIKKNMSNDLCKTINQAMIDFYEQKLSQERVLIDDLCFFFSELLYHLGEALSSSQLLQRLETQYIEIIKRLQLSGETKYILDEFLTLFEENKDTLGGTTFFSIMVDMIHLSGKYAEAVNLITEYLDKFSIDEVVADSYALGLCIRRTHHKMFYRPLSELYDDIQHVINAIDKDKFKRQYCEILFMLGAHIYLPTGKYEEAKQHLRRMMSIARKNDYEDLLCRGLRKYAELNCAQGNLAQSERICRVGLKYSEKSYLKRYWFYLQCVMAETMRLSGKHADALAIFEEQLPTAMALGIKGWVGHVNIAIGNCNADLGNFTEAKAFYDKASTIYREIGQEWGRVNTEVAIQRLCLLENGIPNTEVLHHIKEEADALNYAVLSSRIDDLLSGNRDIIRFEYL
jgi:tetratricopeptide (TPR) repeat protein